MCVWCGVCAEGSLQGGVEALSGPADAPGARGVRDRRKNSAFWMFSYTEAGKCSRCEHQMKRALRGHDR